MSIERAVAILTPAFAALAGLVTSSVGQLVPGVNLNKTDVTVIFVTGATAAAAAALKWLHGRAKFTQDTQWVGHQLTAVAGEVKASPAGPSLDNIEDALKAHTDQIVKAIGDAVHAPASVDQVVEAVAKRLVSAPASTATSPPGPPAPPVIPEHRPVA